MKFKCPLGLKAQTCDATTAPECEKRRSTWSAIASERVDDAVKTWNYGTYGEFQKEEKQAISAIVKCTGTRLDTYNHIEETHGQSMKTLSMLEACAPTEEEKAEIARNKE